MTRNYGTYQDIFEGKIGTAMALLKNRIKLKGSKIEELKIKTGFIVVSLTTGHRSLCSL
jgi:putative sterol carrier protein